MEAIASESIEDVIDVISVISQCKEIIENEYLNGDRDIRADVSILGSFSKFNLHLKNKQYLPKLLELWDKMLAAIAKKDEVLWSRNVRRNCFRRYQAIHYFSVDLTILQFLHFEMFTNISREVLYLVRYYTVVYFCI